LPRHCAKRSPQYFPVYWAEFYSQEALNAYRRALEAELDPTIRLIEFDAHINDEIFARVAADLLMESLRGVTETKGRAGPLILIRTSLVRPLAVSPMNN
jgi:hypothetical protein